MAHHYFGGMHDIDISGSNQLNHARSGQPDAPGIAVAGLQFANVLIFSYGSDTAVQRNTGSFHTKPLCTAVNKDAVFGNEVEGLHAAGLYRPGENKGIRRRNQYRTQSVDVAGNIHIVGGGDHDLVISLLHVANRFGSGCAGVLKHAQDIDVVGFQNDTAVGLDPATASGDFDIAILRSHQHVGVGAVVIILQGANRSVNGDLVQTLQTDSLFVIGNRVGKSHFGKPQFGGIN